MKRSVKFRGAALLCLILLVTLLASSCAHNRRQRQGSYGYKSPQYSTRTHAPQHTTSRGYHRGGVLDNNPGVWLSDNSRVRKFRTHYRGTNTVEIGLNKGAKYLPHITRVFRAKGLPLELAYLPILESFWDPRANSGVARGLWQFTRGTAREMGLHVGGFGDERLNWRKSTEAAADYLLQLGAQFNYDWALALAAYNGGPGYITRSMKKQGAQDYFSLRLVQETYEYVPRFVAMVQVAKEKYPHLLIAAR